MKDSFTITEGQTPSGAKFELRDYFNPLNSKTIARRLEWLAHGDVGPIGVPLLILAPVGQLFFELTRYGSVSDDTRAKCFAC